MNWLEEGRKQGEGNYRAVQRKGGGTTATLSCKQVPAQPPCRPAWAGNLNHKQAAQCTDLYVPPETLFMIKMVVPKGLNLTQVRAGPEDLEELVGGIPWGLHHHIMVPLDLCRVILTKPTEYPAATASPCPQHHQEPSSAQISFCKGLFQP